MTAKDRFRPTYHASVRKGWSNDPNGLIFYKGRVHLFFQHYPHDAKWGPMHWGHYSSADLIQWEEHQVALVPDRDYETVCGCCSGNAIEMDGKLWLMYTAAQPDLQRQCLAYSEDGMTFTKHKNNPVLTSAMLHKEVSPRDFRDPKLFKKDGYYYCLAGSRVFDLKEADIISKEKDFQVKDKNPQVKDNNLQAKDKNLQAEVFPERLSGVPLQAEGLPEQPVDYHSRDDNLTEQMEDYNPSGGVHLSLPVKVLGGDDQGDDKDKGNGNMILFRSKDLIHWEYCGKLFEQQEGFNEEYFRLQGAYECPDYCVVDGKEILLASPQNLPQMGHSYQNVHSVIYLTGHLDFKTGHFAIESIKDLDSGFDIYAPQVVTMPDGRHIMIAWKEMWDRPYPTQEDGWAGTYTLPRELYWEEDPVHREEESDHREGQDQQDWAEEPGWQNDPSREKEKNPGPNRRTGRLVQKPVREIQAYRKNAVEGGPVTLMEEAVSIEGIRGRTIECFAAFDLGDARRVGVRLFKGKDHETVVYYEPASRLVTFDRTRSGISIKTEGDTLRCCQIEDADSDTSISLHIFLDISSVEVFINGGRYVMTSNVYPDPGDEGVEFFSQGGTATLRQVWKYDIEIG